jgi:hypothetical protein
MARVVVLFVGVVGGGGGTVSGELILKLNPTLSRWVSTHTN